MAITITSLLTTIATADTSETTDWSTNNTDIVNFNQGIACQGSKISQTNVPFIYNSTGDTNSPYDLRGRILYVWMMCLNFPAMDIQSDGGFRIRVSNTSATADYGEWNVGGADNYRGGWVCFAVKCDLTENPFDTINGTPPDLSAVIFIGGVIGVVAMISGNFNNGLCDAIRVSQSTSSTGLRINTTSGSVATFQDIIDADEGTIGNKYGIVRQQGKVIFVQGDLVFGGDSAACEFSDSGLVIAYEELSKTSATGTPSSDNFIRDGDFKFVISEDAKVTLGNAAGSGTDTVGSGGVVFVSPTTPGATGPLRWDFVASDSRINALNLYGCQINSCNNLKIGGPTGPAGMGDTSGLLRSDVVEIVDTTFTDSKRMIRNVGPTGPDSGPTGPLYLRNNIISSVDPTASLDIFDGQSTNSSEWAIRQGPGFIYTPDGGGPTGPPGSLANHNFNLMGTPYVTIDTDETWDIINPVWTVTDQTQLDFVSASGNEVNEKFSLDIAVQQADGTAIVGAESYVFETNSGPTGPNIPTDNQQTTLAGGIASSNILTNNYTDGGGTSLSTIAHSGFALKVYDYTRNPFVSTLSVAAALNLGITLTDDANISESNSATAISNGSGITADRLPHVGGQPILQYFAYDSLDSGSYSAGNVITSSGGSSGTIIEVKELTSATGELVVEPDDVGDTFPEDEAITSSGGIGGDIDKGTLDDTFTWHVDCNGSTVQVVYDFLSAQIAEPHESLNDMNGATGPTYLESILWGEEEHGLILKAAGGDTYFTQRNLSLTEGVFLSNRGTGTISGMIADGGNSFSPQSSVPLEINGVVVNARCHIETDPGGVVLMSKNADGTGTATENFTGSTPQDVLVKARLKGFLPFETTGTIETGSGLTVTAVWIVDTIVD